MGAIQPIKGIQVKEHEMEFVRQIQGVSVRDLVTKYYFKNNALCFKILLHLESGETVLYQELTDYSDYKNTLTFLQSARKNGAVIKIPGNFNQTDIATAKVA